MSAPTVSVEWLLARAAANQRGLLHVVSRRDSGLLNPLCGAHPIRSSKIDTPTRLDDVAQLCEGCGALATSFGGTVRDGVDLLLGLSQAATTTRLLELPVVAVNARADHIRRTPGDGLEQLVDSITERGIVTPLIVRRHARRYEVIDGVRRLYAATVAALATVPAIVRDASDVDVLVDGLVANAHRTDLNPIEKAYAYERLGASCGGNKAAVGRLLGISREQVSNTIRLLDLPVEEQQRIATGALTAQAGRAILATGARRPADPTLVAIQDLLAQVLETKVAAVRTRGTDTEIVLRVPTAERDRWIAQLAPAA